MFPEAVQSGAWPPGLRHSFAVSGWPRDLPANQRTARVWYKNGGLQKPAARQPSGVLEPHREKENTIKAVLVSGRLTKPLSFPPPFSQVQP